MLEDQSVPITTNVVSSNHDRRDLLVTCGMSGVFYWYFCFIHH